MSKTGTIERIDIEEAMEQHPSVGSMGPTEVPSVAGELKPGFKGVSPADLLHATSSVGVPERPLPVQSFDKLPTPPGA